MRAIAVAHPNVALVKYWGKQPEGSADMSASALKENNPATPSLSIALSALATRTVVTAAEQDELHVNGHPATDTRVGGLVTAMRGAWDLPPIAVDTCNDFPTSAGLASSASGFAALVTAIDGAFALGLSVRERSVWARRGSASAARSVVGGFAALDRAGHDGEWAASAVLASDAWPLEIVVAVVSDAAKGVPSNIGMEQSRRSSPFYRAWVESTADDFEAARRAVLAQDFDALAQVAEHSCFKMHAVMLATRPALVYWKPPTLACIDAVHRLQDAGAKVFCSIDAGPQVKVVCAPGQSGAVADALARVPGVLRVLESGIGGPARCLESSKASG